MPGTFAHGTFSDVAATQSMSISMGTQGTQGMQGLQRTHSTQYPTPPMDSLDLGSGQYPLDAEAWLNLFAQFPDDTQSSELLWGIMGIRTAPAPASVNVNVNISDPMAGDVSTSTSTGVSNARTNEHAGANTNTNTNSDMGPPVLVNPFGNSIGGGSHGHYGSAWGINQYGQNPHPTHGQSYYSGEAAVDGHADIR